MCSLTSLMVYLTKKRIKNNIYLYLEETARINGKSKRVWSQYLGPEKEIKKWSYMGFDIEKLDIIYYDYGLPVALMTIAEKLD